MRASRKAGFTLVELTVALALGAMLMVAIVGVLQSVSNQLKHAQRESHGDWRSSAKRVLQADLMFAAQISSADGWLWLDGTFPPQGATSEVTRRVGYGCAPGFQEGQSTLMRVADGRGEPVVFGPKRMLVERLDASGTAQPLSEQQTIAPRRVRIWMWLNTDAEDAPSFIQDLVLH
jgi:prepilin-type N-terminal cleavage/methylation domain-containing protein